MATAWWEGGTYSLGVSFGSASCREAVIIHFTSLQSKSGVINATHQHSNKMDPHRKFVTHAWSETQSHVIHNETRQMLSSNLNLESISLKDATQTHDLADNAQPTTSISSWVLLVTGAAMFMSAVRNTLSSAPMLFTDVDQGRLESCWVTLTRWTSY